MPIRTTCLITAALLTFGCVAAPGARAAYTITFTESDGNVMESGSGSFDLTGLRRIGEHRTDGLLFPRGGMFSGGLKGQRMFLYAVPITDPVFWGPGDFSFASSSVGDAVRINVRGPYIGVSPTYESGQPLSESSVFKDSTFESLGLTPGAYVDSWGSGATADSFTVIVDAPSMVPEPASWALMMVGFGALGFLGVRRGKLRSTGA